jgi:hypothetical protein
MVTLLFGYLRKSLDEFRMTGTPGSDCAAAAAIGGSQPMTANAMPATLHRYETPSSAIVVRRRSWP